MSQVAACDPGGRHAMSKNMVEILPHVHQIKSAVIALLIDGLGQHGDVWMGKEKFCTKWNFLGLPGLGIKESRDDWKGPMAALIVTKGSGPM